MWKKRTTGYRKKTYRKNTSKRSQYRKRKVAKRKFNVHQFRITTQAQNIVCPGLIGQGYYLTPQPFQAISAGGLPDAANYIASYDRFYLKKVVIKIVPLYNINTLSQVLDPSTTATGLKYYLSDIHTAIDYNDTAAPTGTPEIMNNPTYRRTRQNRTHIRTLYPKIPDTVGATGTFSNARAINPVVNLNSTSLSTLAYQGLKVWLDACSNTALDAEGLPFKVFYTYYFNLMTPQ